MVRSACFLSIIFALRTLLLAAQNCRNEGAEDVASTIDSIASDQSVSCSAILQANTMTERRPDDILEEEKASQITFEAVEENMIDVAIDKSGPTEASLLVTRQGTAQKRATVTWCQDIRETPLHGKLHAPGICPERSSIQRMNFLRGVPVRNATKDTQLLQRVNDVLKVRKKNHAEVMLFLQKLGKLGQIDAIDILALRETWTDADTDLLRRLDNTPGAFVEGELTTAGIIARLPTVDDFVKTVHHMSDGALAIVGSGSVLKNRHLGLEIDQHNEVVRFNDLVGENLEVLDTGVATSVHVTNARVAPLRDPKISHFDLEGDTVWRTYCGRLHRKGEFQGAIDISTTFMIKPTAYCALDTNTLQFTRGFLFYWLIGRLAPHVDMYGFAGKRHYQNRDKVKEGFVGYEHVVYNESAFSENHVTWKDQLQQQNTSVENHEAPLSGPVSWIG